jgi:apolipoprotein N-acyltransferase
MPVRCFLAVVAGVATALAFPPTHAFWLLPFTVAAFFVLTDGLPARRAWLPGLAFGLGFQVTLLWWLHAVGTVPWLALSATQAAWYAVLAVAVLPLRRLPAAPLWLAAAWVAMEAVRCTWPAGGMPWGRLAYAAMDTPFAGDLPYLGATGVSLVVALLGTLLASLWAALRSRRRLGREHLRILVPALAVVVVALVPLAAPYDASSVGRWTVAAVQGNVPGDGTDVLGHYRQITAQQTDETEQLADDVRAGRAKEPDLVVWPENSTAIDPFLDQEMNTDIEDAVHAIDVPLLAGVVVDGGPRHVLNQGIVFDPVTGAGDRYTKWHPVPFGEYIPWRWLFGTHLPQTNQIPRDMVRGTRVDPLDVRGVKVADAICFDIAYDDGIYAQLQRGGQLLVVQTSNAMFIHTDQIEQQFAISRLRALETHRYVVVAAINGLTGVIAPDGSVVTTTAARTQSYAEANVGLFDAVTPAVQLGPWSGRLCLGLVVVGWALALGRYRRRGRSDSAEPAAAPLTDRTPA